jgi:hypothetical protein
MADTAQSLLQKAMKTYEPGGTFEKTAFADIEAGKQSAIGRSVQGLVSGGMAGSSLMGSVPLIAEKSAAGSRLKVSGEREQLLSGLQVQLANLIAQMEEAQKNRDFTAAQNYADRVEAVQSQIRAQTYGASQSALDRSATAGLQSSAQNYGASQSALQRAHETSMNTPTRITSSGEAPSLFETPSTSSPSTSTGAWASYQNRQTVQQSPGQVSQSIFDENMKSSFPGLFWPG